MESPRLGLEIARGFYERVVGPVVGLPHAAALLGEGSEVLGFDSGRSTDHAWGPRVQLFVDASHVAVVRATVASALPEHFDGLPVRFFAWQDGTVRDHVEVTTVDSWLRDQLRIPQCELTTAAWLALPQQKLLELTTGAVFHDDIGDLTEARERLSWFPRDVWLWALASQWRLIADQEPLMARTAEVGDERGSRLIAAALVRLSMQMCFLQEQRYWPYPKWLGTAFGRLRAAAEMGPALDRLLGAADPSARQQSLVEVLELLARRHNELALTEPQEPSCGPFEIGIDDVTRPHLVLNASRFHAACRNSIDDVALRRVEPVGTVDQLTHASDLLVNFTSWPQDIASTFQRLLDGS